MTKETDMGVTFDEFLTWERASRDTIDFKVAYVDMADGDVLAGLLLSQIVFWHLPGKQDASKLRVERDGHKWLVKGRSEWYDEIRLKPRQVDAAIKLLRDLNLIHTARYRFGGAPKLHIRIDREAFLERWQAVLTQSEMTHSEITNSRNNETVNSNSPIREIRSHQSVKSISPKPTNPLTETTNIDHTETTDREVAAVAAPPPTPTPRATKPAGKDKDRPAAKPAKPAPHPERAPTSQQVLVGAFCAVMGLDPAVKGGMVGEMLAVLKRSRVPPSAEIAQTRYGLDPPTDGGWWWYAHDWRGQKGERPKRNGIEETWGAWELPAAPAAQGAALAVLNGAGPAPQRYRGAGAEAVSTGLKAMAAYRLAREARERGQSDPEDEQFIDGTARSDYGNRTHG